MMEKMTPSDFHIKKVVHFSLTSSGYHPNRLLDPSSLKLQFLKQLAGFDNTPEHFRNPCVAIFATAVTDPFWLKVECSHSFRQNTFFCEYPAISINLNQTYLYQRKDIFCQVMMVYINKNCWHISHYGNSTTLDVHTDSTLTSLSSMLTYWSLANMSRYSIRINNQLGHNCLHRIGFKYQRLVKWRYTDNCSGINSTLHYLLSKYVSYYSHTCMSSSHFMCEDNTCILSAYVCDGYVDCSDKTDEINCTDVCTQGNDTCHHACVSTACVCSDMYYHCLSHECIPLTFLCDNKQDCEDSSDENNCPNRHTIDMITMSDFTVKVINLHFLLILIVNSSNFDKMTIITFK